MSDQPCRVCKVMFPWSHATYITLTITLPSLPQRYLSHKGRDLIFFKSHLGLNAPKSFLSAHCSVVKTFFDPHLLQEETFLMRVE